MRSLRWIAPLILLAACGSSTAPANKCDTEDTFGLVQSVFETRGCTNGACHGQPAETAGGGLDLRPDNAYANLINVPGMSADMALVFPGEQEFSLLYQKVAAKTLGTDLGSVGISGSPMPSSPDVLTEQEVELLRVWIRGGAPETGVVGGAAGSVGCEPSDGDELPNKIPPLPAPAEGKGVQLYSGGWSLPPESENEICYATYYDYSDRIPASQRIACPDAYGGAGRECFTYTDVLLAQDPQSHHAVVEAYIPPAGSPEQWDPKSADWKNWVCLGGANDGATCDPLNAGGCGERSICATAPQEAIACVGYTNGPPEMASIAGFFGQAASRKNIAFAQEPTYLEEFVDGVYGVLPVKGFIAWNSHSFNLSRHETSVEQYMNFTFAEQSERRYLREELIIFDAIFAMGQIAPFTSVETCATFTVPVGANMITLSSHTHQHGRDFRIWYPPNESCTAGPNCSPPTDREPDYRSFVYDDPLDQRFGEDNVLAFNSPDEEDRTFRYCAIFDNGAEDPTTVRRHSQRPDSGSCDFADASDGFLTPCGCTPEERVCLGGSDQGALCGGDDASCGGAGICDACPLAGGVTTEEEMFAVIGSYFVAPPP